MFFFLTKSDLKHRTQFWTVDSHQDCISGAVPESIPGFALWKTHWQHVMNEAVFWHRRFRALLGCSVPWGSGNIPEGEWVGGGCCWITAPLSSHCFSCFSLKLPGALGAVRAGFGNENFGKGGRAGGLHTHPWTPSLQPLTSPIPNCSHTAQRIHPVCFSLWVLILCLHIFLADSNQLG